MESPVDLAEALRGFDALWSPRIAARVNDYDVRIAKVAGEHMWHTHEHTDEFFLVLDGELRIALRDGTAGDGTAGDGTAGDGTAGDGTAGDGTAGDGTAGDGTADGAEREVVLSRNSVFVVPRGVEHKPSSPAGASILMFEPAGTSTVGDADAADVPAHIDATTGHTLGE